MLGETVISIPGYLAICGPLACIGGWGLLTWIKRIRDRRRQKAFLQFTRNQEWEKQRADAEEERKKEKKHLEASLPPKWRHFYDNLEKIAADDYVYAVALLEAFCKKARNLEPLGYMHGKLFLSLFGDTMRGNYRKEVSRALAPWIISSVHGKEDENAAT